MDTYAQGIEALSLIEKEAENKATVKWSSSIIRMLKFIESKGISEDDLSSELHQLSTLLNEEYKASDLRIFYSKLSKKLMEEYKKSDSERVKLAKIFTEASKPLPKDPKLSGLENALKTAVMGAF